MGLKFEQAYPWVSGSLAGIGFGAYSAIQGDVYLVTDPRGFLSMVNDVNAIFVGFLMTTMGIIWSIQDRPGIKFQKQAGTYIHFVGYIFIAAVLCLLSVTVNLIISAAISANQFIHGLPHRLLLPAWITLHVITLVSCYRVIRTFYLISKSDNVLSK